MYGVGLLDGGWKDRNVPTSSVLHCLVVGKILLMVDKVGPFELKVGL